MVSRGDIVDKLSNLNQRREIRLFISSTFTDMYEEREYLVKKIFPGIRSFCRERQVEFTEVDLRWGITNEDANDGKALRICLEEINRCHPYFIGILGERYGWIPDYSDILKDTFLLKKFPFVRQAVLDHSSITEMEIVYGALLNKAVDTHAFFYFKSLNRTDSNHLKLDKLKQKILSSGYPVHQNYENLDQLGTWVKDDLEKVINKLYPAKEDMSYLEAERGMHENFAASRYGGYIENKEYRKVLDSLANKGGVPLVVTGPSGCGKSALLANWSRNFKERNPDTFIVCHYIGAYGPDSSVTALLRRIMAEIKERYRLTDEIPPSSSQLQLDFPLWLNKISDDKLILVIDALNQLEGNFVSFEWLPVHFPKNIRLIISSTEGIVLDTMTKRGWSVLRVRPINIEERMSMINTFLQAYSKKLSEEQLNAVTYCNQCSNPLFLRTVLEEIRIFGIYDKVDDRLNYYLESDNIASLFNRLLQRMELDYGKDLMSRAMKLIWCSRKGLSETELFEIGSFTRLELSRLLIAFDYNLMSRGGLLSFFHVYLRNAVELRYLNTSEERINTHKLIAQYFEVQPICERVIDELPWQYKMSNQYQQLKLFISRIDVFITMNDEKRNYELLGYWIFLKDRADVVKAYRNSLRVYSEKENDVKELIRVMNELARFYQYMIIDYEEAGILYEKCIDMSNSYFGEKSLNTARYINNLATLLQDSNRDYEKAMILYGKSMEIREKLAPNSEDLADNLNNLATLYVDCGNFSSEVETLFKRAITIYKTVQDVNYELISNAMRNLAILYFMNKKYRNAEILWNEALSMCENTFGLNHVGVASNLFCLARLFSEIKGDYIDAEKYCRRGLKIEEDIYGIEHLNTVQSRSLLANILYELGNYQDSEEMAKRNISIYKTSLSVTYNEAYETNLLGIVLWKQRKYDEAEDTYRHAIELGERNPSETEVSRNITKQNLAVVLRDIGLFKNAEDILLHMLEYWRKSKNNDYYTALCMYHLGVLYFKKGELNKAESMYLEAVKLWENNNTSVTSHYCLCLYELSKIYTSRKDITTARKLLKRALKIQTNLKGNNHPDTCIIRDALSEI